MNALYQLAWTDFGSFLLIFLRISIVFSLIPFFSSESMPRRIRATIVFFMTMILLPVVPPVKGDTSNLLSLIMFMLQDVLVGMTIGLAISIIFAGVQTAGQFVGFQMGFSIVNVIDPITGVDAPVTANLFYLCAFLLFLAFGGDHMLIKAMVQSFTLVPLDGTLPHSGFYTGMVRYGAGMFSIALKVAAPAIGILLILNVAFGVLARAVPQMNIFMMSFPVTITLGFIFVVISFKLMPFFLEGSVKQAMDIIQTALKAYG